MSKLLLILLPIAVLLSYKWFSRLPAEQRKKRLKQGAIVVGVVLLLGLAVRGGAYQTAAVGAIGLTLLRLLPFVAQRYFQSKFGAGSKPPPSGAGAGQGAGPARPGQMTSDEALQILGLPEGATREQILERYKELMKNNHPDRGGSGYLASQINRAKDTLLR